VKSVKEYIHFSALTLLVRHAVLIPCL